jgi:predicted lipoprotein with Yx(FWY)xxD motif
VRNHWTFGAAFTTVALLVAGCGSSSSSSTKSAAQPAAASTQATAASEGKGYGASGTSTSAAGTSAVPPITVTAKHNKLGTILAAGSKRLTVYMFEGDKGSASSCSGACTAVWPPVITSGAPQASGAATSADLGTTTRSDGKLQVTYHGHPLYYFSRDGDSGDAYGQGIKGFGAEWYVLSPSGAKVDNS